MTIRIAPFSNEIDLLHNEVIAAEKKYSLLGQAAVRKVGAKSVRLRTPIGRNVRRKEESGFGRKENEMKDWTDKRLTKQSGKEKRRQKEKGNAYLMLKVGKAKQNYQEMG